MLDEPATGSDSLCTTYAYGYFTPASQLGCTEFARTWGSWGVGDRVETPFVGDARQIPRTLGQAARRAVPLYSRI